MKLVPPILNYGQSFDYVFQEDILFLSDWEKLLKVASWAQHSSHRFPIAAGIFKTRKAADIGVNKASDSPQLFPNRKSLHAEICAIKRAGIEGACGATIYVARLNKDKSSMLLAKPCLYCIKEMFYYELSRVVYSVDDHSAVAFKLSTVTSPFLEPVEKNKYGQKAYN